MLWHCCVKFKFKLMKKVSYRISFLPVLIIFSFFISCVSCGKKSEGTTTADVGAIVTPPVVTPPIVTPPAGPIVNVGDGKSTVTIDGKVTTYAAGTTIIVKAGTYANGINIQNLTGVTVQGTDVILDGLSQSKDGFYNCLNLNNLTNVTISGFTTKDNGYRMVNINSRMVGLTLNQLTFTNCNQGFSISGGQNIVWDGTDNTVNLLNFSVTNSTFNNCGGSGLGGGIENGKITNMIKNLVISGNTFTGGNPGDIFECQAVDGFQIFNNTITGVNLNSIVDNRLFMMTGNGDAYNNKFTNYEGHAIGIWPLTFGTTPKTCHIHNNTCIGSTRYAAFEMQEFAAYAIPGVTTHADLIVDSNIAGNMNTSQWTGYPGTFIDNYQFGYLGGSTTLTNNVGYNWFPQPTLPYLWNLAAPAVVAGNVYTAKAP